MTDKARSYGSLWVRVLAFVFDYFAIASYLALVTILGLVINFTSPNTLRELFGNPLSGQITGFFLITLPVTLYFALFESSRWQATWGKQKQRLKVIRTNGEGLSKPRAVSRTLLKFIPWELAHTRIWQISFAPQESSPLITAGFVLVWILVGANVLSLLLNKSHQTLYDRLAGTYVVRE